MRDSETNNLNIIGISVRTSNKNEQSAKDMGVLWGRFYAENLAYKIQGKLSNDIYSIYTDYSGDYTGDHTAIIGMRVS